MLVGDAIATSATTGGWVDVERSAVAARSRSAGPVAEVLTP
jgi:hypothetical protein